MGRAKIEHKLLILDAHYTASLDSLYCEVQIRADSFLLAC